MTSPFNPFQSSGPASGPPPSGGPGWGSVVPTGLIPGGAPSTGAEGSLKETGPPLVILIAAGVVALAGIAIGAVFFSDALAIIGWALAGPIAIGLMGAFVRGDTDRRAEPGYLRPTWVGTAYALVALASFAGIAVGAVGFALWVGRL